MNSPMISRRRALTAFGAALAAGALPAAAQQVFDAKGGDNGLKLSEAQIKAGASLLSRHASVDIHAHPGRFFLRDLGRQNATSRAMGAPFEPKALADMAAGQVSAVLFNCVSDAVLLEQSPTKGLVAGREFDPGEAFADYQRQIGTL